MFMIPHTQSRVRLIYNTRMGGVTALAGPYRPAESPKQFFYMILLGSRLMAFGPLERLSQVFAHRSKEALLRCLLGYAIEHCVQAQ